MEFVVKYQKSILIFFLLIIIIFLENWRESLDSCGGYNSNKLAIDLSFIAIKLKDGAIWRWLLFWLVLYLLGDHIAYSELAKNRIVAQIEPRTIADFYEILLFYF